MTRIALAIILTMLLAACSTSSPMVQTKVVEVPSSKPYRFIRWSQDDTPETIAAVARHNRAHQAVIDAEKKAR